MKHILAVIAVLALASCGTMAQISGMVAVPSSQLDSNSQLHSAVSLGNIIGGQGTRGLRASEVSSLAFEEALRQSLAAQEILAQDEARFRLDAQIEGIVHPLFGYNVTVTSTVNYTLTEIATSRMVFQQEISESDTAALAVAFSGEDRLRLALEGSIKANITSFIELLRQSIIPARAQNGEATAILEGTAQAMGGLQALRGLTNQTLEVSGQQFEPEQALLPGGEARHVADFCYTLTREIANPRLHLEWDARTIYPRDGVVRFLEIIDGDYGLLQETAAGGVPTATRMHPGRLASRLREERRAAVKIVFTALENASLTQLPDAEVAGVPQHVLTVEDGEEVFHIYLDIETKLPTQVDILEHDTIYGDSRYTLRYADWQSVDGIMVPFERRYEINGLLLQSERVESVRHNVALTPETFLVPDAIAHQEVEGESIASQWILRRLAMNVSYLDFGKDIAVEFVPLAEGVTHLRGTSHNSVLIELQDYLVVVEAPLYEERSENVLAAIKRRFPAKPIRYVIPTHFHNDHSGGMRTYMTAGVSVIVPAISAAHYEGIARAPNTIRPAEQSGNASVVEGITEPRFLSDGSQQIAIYPYATSHAEDYQIIYLPQDKFLIEADHVSPRAGGSVRPGALPRQLLEGIEELQLDVQTIIGIHGDVGSYEDLHEAVRGVTP